jgi:hypothetical protein
MSNAHRPQHAMPLSCVFTHLHSHLAIKGLATNWLLLNKTKKKQYRPMKLQRRLGKRGFEGEKETGRVKHPKKKGNKKKKRKAIRLYDAYATKKKKPTSLSTYKTPRMMVKRENYLFAKNTSDSFLLLPSSRKEKK